jgi:hypothetical protein
MVIVDRLDPKGQRENVERRATAGSAEISVCVAKLENVEREASRASAAIRAPLVTLGRLGLAARQER